MNPINNFIKNDNKSKNNLVAYHGTANADKVEKQGFDFNKANYIKNTVFLATQPSAALFWTGVKYGGDKAKILPKTQTPKNILKVTISNEDKYINEQEYRRELNKILIQKNAPPLPWYNVPFKQSNYTKLKSARRQIVPQLKKEGYRGAILTSDKEIQVYYPEDIKNVKRYK